MIIPIGAPAAYVTALNDAFKRYSMEERSQKEIQAFCEAFQLGWEASKNATFQILERINEGQNDE